MLLRVAAKKTSFRLHISKNIATAAPVSMQLFLKLQKQALNEFDDIKARVTDTLVPK